MSFREFDTERSHRGYTPFNNNRVVKSNGKMDEQSASIQLASSIEDIKKDLEFIEPKVTEFNRMFRNLGTRVDNQQLRNELKKSIHELENIMSILAENIEEMDKYAKLALKDRKMLIEVSEIRRRKEKYAAQINDLITKTEDFIRRNPPHTSPTTSYLDTEEIENKFESVNRGHANLQYNDLLIRERQEDIVSMANEMNTVRDLFMDITQIIHDQGEMIDDIESHVTHAAEQSKYGVRQIVEAKNQQKNSKGKCWTVLIILCVVVIVIVGLLFWYALSHRK